MNGLMKVTAAFFLMVMCSSCLYANIQTPLDLDYNKTDLGSKVGEAQMQSVLFLFSWGNAGTHAAVENGNIQVIKHADVKVFSVLFGLYSRVTTVVYGD